MSDIETEIDSEESPSALREAAERGKAASAEAAAAKRELALVKAGVDTETQKGLMFAKAYDGELTTDAIKAAYNEIFGELKTEPVAPEADADIQRAKEALNRQTAERRELSGQGTEITPEPEPDPRKGVREKFNDDVMSGMSRERAYVGVLNAQIKAANENRPGAVWEGWTNEDLDR